MNKRLFNINGVTIDLEKIIYVSDAGHISLEGQQEYHSVSKGQAKEVVAAWSEWITGKDSK